MHFGLAIVEAFTFFICLFSELIKIVLSVHFGYIVIKIFVLYILLAYLSMFVVCLCA